MKKIINKTSFRGIGFRAVLCIVALGFMTSCGDGNDDGGSVAGGNNGGTAPDTPWYELDYGVKASLSQQTCSDKKPMTSYIIVDFKDVELAEGIDANEIKQATFEDFKLDCFENKASNGDCDNFPEDQDNLAGNVERTDDPTIMPRVSFGPIDYKYFNEKFEVKFDLKFINSDGDSVSLTPNPITLNFPHTTCGDAGDTSCNKNPCKDVPESHMCIFVYEKCADPTVLCADGYSEITDDTKGTLFNDKRCVKN